MYQSIIESINTVIEKHESLQPVDQGLSESEVFYFVQGLEVAKQIVEQMQDLNVDELAYETLEEVLITLKDKLEKNEVEDIVDDVYGDED